MSGADREEIEEEERRTERVRQRHREEEETKKGVKYLGNLFIFILV